MIVSFVIFAFSTTSCKKEVGGKPVTPFSSAALNKSKAVRTRVQSLLKDLVVTFPAGSTTTTSCSSTTVFSVSGAGITTYSTSSSTTSSWGDPTTGTTYSFTQSTGGGAGGLGQLSYNGKSFDYNYVISIKASNNDPSWSGFMNGRDLRGSVAIDGQLTSTTFTIKNLAIFLVATTGGSGTYKFIDWSSTSVGSGDGIGELLDFSDVVDNTLAGMNNAHFYLTSDGHINVSDSAFEMQSDAKVTDVVTNAQYSLEGSLMFF